jgi:hypothetical protein
MVMNVYGGYGVKINASLVGGITQLGIPTGTEARGDATSGQLSPGMMSLITQKPRINFTTKQLARALAACGISGFACSTGTFLTLFAQKRVNEGGRSTSADSVTAVVKKGLLYPEKLSWSQGGDAMLSYGCAVIWDGTNDPIVFAANTAVPGSLLDDQAYGLLSCQIGGVSITQVQSLELDFGIKVATSGGDGEAWDQHACIEEIKPVITVKTTDLSILSSIGLFKAATQANSTVVFRPRIQGGKYAGTGNVTVAAAGMAHVEEPINASATSNAEATIVMNVNYDSTNAILLFS